MRSSASLTGRFPFALVLLFFCLALPGLWPTLLEAAPLADPDVLEVKADPNGGVRATARVMFPAEPELIQSLLTDYAHWPDLFDVQMRLVHLKIHEGIATTDFRIEHALLPGERRLVTESRMLPNGGLVTDLVGGDFKKYHRAWKLTPAPGGAQTIAEFELVVAIDSIVPDWLVALAMRRELEAHFRIVKEKALARSR
jgi:hypothetical protein